MREQVPGPVEGTRVSLLLAACCYLVAHRLFGWQSALVFSLVGLQHLLQHVITAPLHTLLVAAATAALLSYDRMRARRPPSEAARTKVYFERQRLMHCGIHALNNMFGEDWISKNLLDALADSAAAREEAQMDAVLKEQQMERPVIDAMKGSLFGWLNHRWPVVGNYSLPAIQLALKLKGCATRHEGAPRFCDVFKEQNSLMKLIREDRVKGIILHVTCRPSSWYTKCLTRLVGANSGGHWLSVVPAPSDAEKVLLLDSNLEGAQTVRPCRLLEVLNSHGYLTDEQNNEQILVVVVEEPSLPVAPSATQSTEMSAHAEAASETAQAPPEREDNFLKIGATFTPLRGEPSSVSMAPEALTVSALGGDAVPAPEEGKGTPHGSSLYSTFDTEQLERSRARIKRLPPSASINHMYPAEPPVTMVSPSGAAAAKTSDEVCVC